MSLLFVYGINRFSHASIHIIPTLSPKSYFVDIIVHFKNRLKENNEWDLSKCKSFSPANQIAQNKHNDEVWELLGVFYRKSKKRIKHVHISAIFIAHLKMDFSFKVSNSQQNK